MAVEEAYFSCAKCGSLVGGIFGKGPIRKYDSDNASRCVHDWQRTSRIEFQALTTDRFGVDWSNEIPFFQPVAHEDGIDRREAYLLADDYYQRVLRIGCGALGQPTAGEGSWVFPVHFGYGGVHIGDIHVDASASDVMWYPKSGLSPAQPGAGE